MFKWLVFLFMCESSCSEPPVGGLAKHDEGAGSGTHRGVVGARIWSLSWDDTTVPIGFRSPSETIRMCDIDTNRGPILSSIRPPAARTMDR
jgi:hypothetical protein